MKSFFKSLSHGTRSVIVFCVTLLVLIMVFLIVLMIHPINRQINMNDYNNALISAATEPVQTEVTQTTAQTQTTATAFVRQTTNRRRETVETNGEEAGKGYDSYDEESQTVVREYDEDNDENSDRKWSADREDTVKETTPAAQTQPPQTEAPVREIEPVQVAPFVHEDEASGGEVPAEENEGEAMPADEEEN